MNKDLGLSPGQARRLRGALKKDAIHLQLIVQNHLLVVSLVRNPDKQRSLCLTSQTGGRHLEEVVCPLPSAVRNERSLSNKQKICIFHRCFWVPKHFSTTM
jgi:hypothetical protein